MKKKGSICYLLFCLIICILPFAGMTVAPTDTTTENKRLASFPDIKMSGKWNRSYLKELGSYFEDHFALRPYFVAVDSMIQNKLFRVSNMDTVIAGKDGWLYYSATLDDYLGQNLAGKRRIYNIAHNLSLMQQYVEDSGAEFVFTVPPDKNSLYGQQMPYYDSETVSEHSNMEHLQAELKKQKVTYVDLFSAFENQEEILYLKRDSHWNNKGAVLAYNTILDTLQQEHNNYETVLAIRSKTKIGDLNAMLYPVFAQPEWDYEYQKNSTYRYVTKTDSVEDAFIETENEQGEGSLLMFRDSFGNTLLPLMADAYQNACFSKALPYDVAACLKEYHPKTVIVEKVERNVEDLATNPPVMPGPVVSLSKREIKENLNPGTTINIESSDTDAGYYEIKGRLEPDSISEDTRVYINVTMDSKEETREAFTTSGKQSDNGYLLYLPKENVLSDNVTIAVFTDHDGVLKKVKEKKIKVSEVNYG